MSPHEVRAAALSETATLRTWLAVFGSTLGAFMAVTSPREVVRLEC